jgi:hypothetical protein
MGESAAVARQEPAGDNCTLWTYDVNFYEEVMG